MNVADEAYQIDVRPELVFFFTHACEVLLVATSRQAQGVVVPQAVFGGNRRGRTDVRVQYGALHGTETFELSRS